MGNAPPRVISRRAAAPITPPKRSSYGHVGRITVARQTEHRLLSHCPGNSRPRGTAHSREQHLPSSLISPRATSTGYFKGGPSIKILSPHVIALRPFPSKRGLPGDRAAIRTFDSGINLSADGFTSGESNGGSQPSYVCTRIVQPISFVASHIVTATEE